MGDNKCFLGRSLRFITLLSVIVALSCVTFSPHLYAHTISPTIGLPYIRWDSAPSGAGGGITTFAPGTGLLSTTGSVVYFVPNTIVPPNPMVGGTVSIYASLVGTTITPPSGGFPGLIHADFGTAGTLGYYDSGTSQYYDVVIKDISGAIALAGDFGGLTIDGIFGKNRGFGGAIFTPTLGYLLPDFPVPAGIVHGEYNLAPTWSATSYTAPWSSESKGGVGPVPEPLTIALLGTGLFGFLGYRRFWRKN